MGAPVITAFGRMPDGRPVEQYTLKGGGMECGVITCGAALRALKLPGRNGRAVDVLLGFDRLEDYLAQDKYIGAVIGRYANRIGGAAFELNGRRYALAANSGPNHLHGGRAGFDRQLWTVEEAGADFIALSLLSPDGQEGYPGNLSVLVGYRLGDGGLTIEYRAESDGDTLCNLTNHAYFNLEGHRSGPVLGQTIQLFAGSYTPAGAGSIPTGEIAPVEGSPMDLRQPAAIGERIDEDFPQLAMAGGYDHNWVIDGEPGRLRMAARAHAPGTGITMELLTTQPGVQFYTGNYLDGCPAGKGGARYGRRCGFCLETQHFPDSPNRPGFPKTVLRAGERYLETTVYRFAVE